VSTVASTLALVQGLHTGFASVTEAQITAVWVEVVQRTGSKRWPASVAPTAYALMAAHLLAMRPSGSPGSGVGLVTTSSSSSGLSITRRLAAADPRNYDLTQTTWGERWLGLVRSQPTISAPVILF